MKNFLIEFFIKLGATLFYAMLALLILGGGSINGYKVRGILNIIIEMLKKQEVVMIIKNDKLTQKQKEINVKKLLEMIKKNTK